MERDWAEHKLSTNTTNSTNFPFHPHRSNPRVRQSVHPNIFDSAGSLPKQLSAATLSSALRPQFPHPNGGNRKTAVIMPPNQEKVNKDRQSLRAAKYQEKLQKQQLAQLIYAGEECLDPDSTRRRLQKKVKRNSDSQRKSLLDRQQLPLDLNRRIIDQKSITPNFIRHFSADGQFDRLASTYPRPAPKPVFELADPTPKNHLNSNNSNTTTTTNNNNHTNTSKRKPKSQKGKKQKKDKRQKQNRIKKSPRDKLRKANQSKSDKPKKSLVEEGQRTSEPTAMDVDSESELKMDGSSPDIDRVPLLSGQSFVDTSLVSESNREPLLLLREVDTDAVDDADQSLSGSDGVENDVPGGLAYDSDDEEDHCTKEYQSLPHTAGERKPLLGGDRCRTFATFGHEQDESQPSSSSSPSPNNPSPKRHDLSTSRGLPPPPASTLSALAAAQVAETKIVSQTGSDDRVNEVLKEDFKKEFDMLVKTHKNLDAMFPDVVHLPLVGKTTGEVGSSSKNPKSGKKAKKNKSKAEKEAGALALAAAAERKRAKKRQKKQLARTRKRQRLAETRFAEANKNKFKSVEPDGGSDECDADGSAHGSGDEQSDRESVRDEDEVEVGDVADEESAAHEDAGVRHEDVVARHEDVVAKEVHETSETKSKRPRRRRRKKNNTTPPRKPDTPAECSSLPSPTTTLDNQTSPAELPCVSTLPTEPSFTVVKSKSRRKKSGQSNRNVKRSGDLETISIVRTQPQTDSCRPRSVGSSPRSTHANATAVRATTAQNFALVGRVSETRRSPPTTTDNTRRMRTSPRPMVVNEPPRVSTSSVGLQAQDLSTENVPIQSRPFLQTHPPANFISWPTAPYVGRPPNFSQEVPTSEANASPNDKPHRRPTKPPVTGLRSFFAAKDANIATAAEACDAFSFDSASMSRALSHDNIDGVARSGARTPQDTNSVTTTDADEQSTSVSTQSGPVHGPIPVSAGHRPLQDPPLVPRVPMMNGLNPADMYPMVPPQMFTPMFPYPFPTMFPPMQPDMISKEMIDAIAAVTGDLSAGHPFMIPMPGQFLQPQHLHAATPPSIPRRSSAAQSEDEEVGQEQIDNVDAPVVSPRPESVSRENEDMKQGELISDAVEDSVITDAKQSDREHLSATKETENGNTFEDDGVSQSDTLNSSAGSENEQVPDLSNHSHEGSEPALDDMKNAYGGLELTQSETDESGDKWVRFTLDKKYPEHIFNLNSEIEIESKDLSLDKLLRIALS